MVSVDTFSLPSFICLGAQDSPPLISPHNLGFYHIWTPSPYGFSSFHTEIQTHNQATWAPGTLYHAAWPNPVLCSRNPVFSASLRPTIVFFCHVPCHVKCFLVPLHCLTHHNVWPPFPCHVGCMMPSILPHCPIPPHNGWLPLFMLYWMLSSPSFSLYCFTSHHLAATSHVVFVICCLQMPCYCSVLPHRTRPVGLILHFLTFWVSVPDFRQLQGLQYWTH